MVEVENKIVLKKKGRGRPKGSLNKNRTTSKTASKICTVREVRFVDEYLACFSYAEAFRRITPPSSKIDLKTVNRRGKELAVRPRVRKLMLRRMAVLRKKCKIETEEVILRLQRNEQDAYEAGELKESTRCLELLGKAIAMFTDRTEVDLAMVPLGPREIIKNYPKPPGSTASSPPSGQEDQKCLTNG